MAYNLISTQTSSGFSIYLADGSDGPEGFQAAIPGSWCRQKTLGVDYKKATGTGNTGWVLQNAESEVAALLAALGSAAYQPSSAFATPAYVDAQDAALDSSLQVFANNAASGAQTNAEAYADSTMLAKAQNLADLDDVSAAIAALGLGTAAMANTGDFATAAQGATADSAVQPGDLATVATTGVYNDLSGKPTLGTAAAQNAGAFDPAGSAAAAQAASQPLDADLTAIAALTTTSFGRGLLTQVDAVAVRTAIGAGVGGGSVTSVGLTSSNLTIGGSPVTTSGNLTVALPNTGTAGTYTSITTDAQGRVISGALSSITNNPARTIQTVAAAGNGWQISTTRVAHAIYSVTITANASGLLAGAQVGYIVLEVAATNSSTAGDWVEVSRVTNGQSINSILTLASQQPVGATLSGYVPVGYYCRMRSVNVTGTPSYQLASGQEILL